MTGITLLVSNPAARHVETDVGDWVVSGFDPEPVATFVASSPSFDEVVKYARSLPGEYSIVFVDTGVPGRVSAFRSITSTFDVFYCERPTDGELVVGDHFREVLSTLPVSNRTVPESVAVEQLLFGTVPNGSYVEEIDRLGHGERVDLTVGSPPDPRLVDTLSVDRRIDPVTAERRIARELDAALSVDRFEQPVVTMLSGGVDSTLLHTYLDTDRTVSGSFDSPEFEFEAEYARQASALVGSTHELLSFDEGDYLQSLEATIDAVGQPLLLPQAVLMDLVFAESEYQVYLNGGLADGLFGTGDAALAYLGQHLGIVSWAIPELSWELAALKRSAAGLTRPATALDGIGMNFRIHADQTHVADMFGQEAVDAAKRNRLQYTLDRVELDASPGYDAHMHLGHLVEYFHDVILVNWRHAAHARGKTMLAPFAGREFLETVLAIPAADRFARFTIPPLDSPTRFVQNKYLMKDLLGSRVPAYDTKQAKGHGLLPVKRYMESGPLSTVFDTYSVPEFVPEAFQESVRTGTEEVSWYAANFAIWRDRVLENDALVPFETTSVMQYDASQAAARRPDA